MDAYSFLNPSDEGNDGGDDEEEERVPNDGRLRQDKR